MWSTHEELEAALRQAGLGDGARRVAAAARYAIILEPGPVEEGGDAPIGASRLGGMPDLPPGMSWPRRPAVTDGPGVFSDHAARPWPLSFVAQVDFAEIQSAGRLEGFPLSGRLLLFCDPVDCPWGETIDDQTRSSVMFIMEHEDRLARRAPPVEFTDPQHEILETRDFVFEPRRLRPRLWLLPPPWGSRELSAISGRAPQDWEAAYEQFWRDVALQYPSAFGPHWPSTGGKIHQVGGIAFSIQGPVEADCVKFADDDYNNQPEVIAWFERPRDQRPAVGSPEHEVQWQAFKAFDDARTPTYLERADSWQLVLQIDSDSEAGMQWGDAGRIYVCIRKQDLAESRFERCWTIVQCT